MKHILPELPFQKDALAPTLSAETLEYHHSRHHKAYVDKTNELIRRTEFENAPLEQIVMRATGPLFNNAAQAWNHDFYWKSLTPKSGEPPRELLQAIQSNFGSLKEFLEKFNQAAAGVFGSGWAWLVQNQDGGLLIETTPNADNPIRHGRKPLLTVDVWEHAYYIDYRNERPKYLRQIASILNWEFAAENLKREPGAVRKESAA